MRVFACPAQRTDETRSAITDASAKGLIGLGVDLATLPGVGQQAGVLDQALKEVGVVLPDAGGCTQNNDAAGRDGSGSSGGGGGEQPLCPVLAEELGKADLVLAVDPPSPQRILAMKPGAVLVGLLEPVQQVDVVKACQQAKVTAMAMEFVPRISRAQAADALSSQASIAGYKAVLMAADRCPKLMPMMMTAAGTLSPARVFVIGAGVAGLQAIATAKRLGAIVEAFDVRSATKEQVQSLGARFIEIKLDADADAAGGYAKELTAEQREKQTQLMAKHIQGSDVVITTAAVFGKAPPTLISQDVVKGMQPGAVIVDLGVSKIYGKGNCESAVPGEVVTTENGVTVVGTTNLPSLVPLHASQAYANNLLALVKAFVQDGAMHLDLEDEVIGGATIVHDGVIRSDVVKQAVEASEAN